MCSLRIAYDTGADVFVDLQLFPRQSAEQRDSIIDEILSSVFKVAEMKKAQTHIRSANLRK